MSLNFSQAYKSASDKVTRILDSDHSTKKPEATTSEDAKAALTVLRGIISKIDADPTELRDLAFLLSYAQKELNEKCNSQSTMPPASPLNE